MRVNTLEFVPIKLKFQTSPKSSKNYIFINNYYSDVFKNRVFLSFTLQITFF